MVGQYILSTYYEPAIQFSSVTQSCLTFATTWTTAHQASLSITNCRSLTKPMSIELVTPSNHLILCRLLLLLPSMGKIGRRNDSRSLQWQNNKQTNQPARSIPRNSYLTGCKSKPLTPKESIRIGFISSSTVGRSEGTKVKTATKKVMEIAYFNA